VKRSNGGSNAHTHWVRTTISFDEVKQVLSIPIDQFEFFNKHVIDAVILDIVFHVAWEMIVLVH
jgi:hypothetical protein